MNWKDSRTDAERDQEEHKNQRIIQSELMADDEKYIPFMVKMPTSPSSEERVKQLEEEISWGLVIVAR